MTLHLVRHGETALNAARVLQPADTPLSAHGLAQAEALGRRIAAWPHAALAGDAGEARIAGVLASDLPRARQTAEAIARACKLTPSLSDLLQERNFGDLRGRPYDSLGFDPLAQADAPPGGESMAVFGQRCDAAWAELQALQARLGGPLVVVTHGLVLRAWLARVPLMLPAGTEAPSAWHNTSLTTAADEPPHTVRRLNCTAHLGGTLVSGRHSLSGG